MRTEEKRDIRRQGNHSECEIRLSAGIFKGRVVDYSTDGISAVVDSASRLVPGIHADINITDHGMKFRGKVMWIKEVANGLKAGFKRIDDLKGAIKDLKLAELLISLQRNIKTGVLDIESGSTVKKIFIRNGDIVFAASNNEDDRLGAFLLKNGQITFEEYSQASQQLEKTGQRYGKILVSMGCLTPKELYTAVQSQIEGIILSVFTIEDAAFQFREGPLPSEEVITLRISAANLIYRGIKRISNVPYINKVCPSVDDVLDFSPDPLNVFQDLILEEQDKKILAYVNGVYPLKAILSFSPYPDFETLRTVCALLNTGLIRVKTEVDEPVVYPIEEVLSKPAEKNSEGFEEIIENMFQKCESLNYYEVLGVKSDSSSEEIRDAYYRISRQFHPDRHFDLPSQEKEIKDKLSHIFSCSAKAYETLSDPANKMEYDSLLAGKAEVKEEKAAEGIVIPTEEPLSECLAPAEATPGEAGSAEAYSAAEGADEVQECAGVEGSLSDEEKTEAVSEPPSSTGAEEFTEVQKEDEGYIVEGAEHIETVSAEAAETGHVAVAEEEKTISPETGVARKSRLYISAGMIAVILAAVILMVRGFYVPAEKQIQEQAQEQISKTAKEPRAVVSAVPKLTLPLPSLNSVCL
ncbi:MAG: DnaJ domain-containing protein [Nitrospirae bacterium]|nr:DnaJ domain-containing protein [Nitrospirota bacterium]